MAATDTLMMSDKKGVHALVMAAHHYGVEHVVICPGSRNAPFTISFSRSGLFTCHSIADERVAGFYALGMALATGKPVVVVCTSGSAGINLGPALAEAFYLKAPLVAITADRPLAWTDQGNGQTIRQEGLFANYIRGAYSLIEEPKTADEAWLNRREISKTFNRLVAGAGPIHFNAPLSEPLYRTQAYPAAFDGHLYKRQQLNSSIHPKDLKIYTASFSNAKKVMLLIGQIPADDALNKAVAKLASMPNVVVLTETTSNISAPGVVSNIDRIVMSVKGDLLDPLMPEILITMGGMIVSKKIKSLIRDNMPAHHWHINPHDEGLDTFKALTAELPCQPAAFLENLAELEIPMGHSDYRHRWQTLNHLSHEGHSSYLDEMPWSDFKAFAQLMPALQAPLTLHMANSSPVRYVQLFGMTEGIHYHANRGTSGIDGSTSTAAGWAKAHPDEEVLLITGDTAFMYDSNALWNNALPQNLKICVINNSGGGIFRIIEGPASTEELEPFFEAHHPVDIEHIAGAFGLKHMLATDESSLSGALPEFLAHKGFALLEIRTPAKVNAPVLKGYFKHIAAHFSERDLAGQLQENH